MSGVERVETRTQWMWLDEEGVLHCQLKPGIEVGGDDAREVIRMLSGLIDGKRRPTLVDIRDIRAVSREARAFFSGPETAEVEAAAALLVDSPLTRAIGNFFLGLNKPVIPIRVFNAEEEALAWLRSFLR